MGVLHVRCKLTGVTTLGFSAPISSPKDGKESHDAYEERTWRERMHTDGDGNVILLPTSIKNCLVDVSQYLGEHPEGTPAKTTWTKYFKTGVLVAKPLELNVKAVEVERLRLFVPADGRRNGKARVWKNFPVLAEWQCEVELMLLVPRLTEQPKGPAKVQEYLEHAGSIIGLGFSRPINNGYFGRFKVSEFEVVR